MRANATARRIPRKQDGISVFSGSESRVFDERISLTRFRWTRGAEMPIGLLTLEIHISDARSLKDKRQVLRSLKDRLRAHFNVAVAELDHHDVWQRSRIGVVGISNDSKHLEESMSAVAAESERVLGRDLVSQEIEYFEDGA